MEKEEKTTENPKDAKVKETKVKEEKKEETPVTEESTEQKPKGSLNLKIFYFGVPLFIVQLVAVYFITANFLLSSQNEILKKEEQKTEVTAGSTELGKFVFLIDDIIVNPSDTDGKRLLLASIGLDLQSEVAKTELKEKEVIVKDVIITTLSSKTWAQLNESSYKDTLKNEISSKLQKLIPRVKINTVYLSKYITQ
jgi:flagellar FliL protein